MKKTLILLSFLALLPAAAGAQVPPQTRIAPGPPAAPPANGHGITVNGTSIAHVPASSARILMQLTSVDNKSTLNQQTLAPLADALIKAGAEPSTVRLPLTFSAGGYSNVATVSAVVANPTVDVMRSGINGVGAVIANMPNVRLTSAQVQLTASDCTQALSKVRADAIEAARSKAAFIAKQLGVKLGSVLNVSSFDQPNSDGSCSTQYWVGPLGPQFAPGSDNTDSDYVSVSVTSNVTITYAIR